VHDHREILALAAAEIDFDLDPDERQRLLEALETCSLCRRQVAAMRATATVLRRPLDIGTPGRVRDVVIGSVLRRDRPIPGLRTLLAAGLSILVVLGGTAAFIGTRGLGILPAASPSASVPAQSAVAESSPPPSPASGPDATQVPPPSPTTSPTPGQTAGPLRPGEVAAMVTDGRLVIRTLPETGANSAIFKTRLYPGQRVVVLEGPVEGDGYQWLRVRLGDIEGWASAADRDGTPWLSPVRNGVIAFVVDGDGGTADSIHTIDGNGTTGEAVLFADPTLRQYEQLTWSPDGRRLAFVATPADSASGTTEIFTMDADGTNLARITTNDVDDDSPAWSPDGTRLAIRMADVDPATQGDSDIVVASAIGPQFTLLGPGSDPSWAPDGQRIASIVADADSSHLWVQAPDGTGRRQVSDVPVTSGPSWSPDGLQILVSYAGPSSAAAGLSVIDVESGSATSLLDDATSWPTWSITGTIAFSATGTGAPGLFVAEPDGTDLRQVLADQGFAAVAAWAPNGRWLLLGDEHTGSPVTLIDVDSGEVVVIDSARGINRSPAWQPRVP
jgi:Tol biopolymer transport system component